MKQQEHEISDWFRNRTAQKEFLTFDTMREAVGNADNKIFVENVGWVPGCLFLLPIKIENRVIEPIPNRDSFMQWAEKLKRHVVPQLGTPYVKLLHICQNNVVSFLYAVLKMQNEKHDPDKFILLLKRSLDKKKA